MTQQPPSIKKIIKPRILGILEAIGAAILVEGLRHLLPLFHVEPKVLLANWLPLMLLLLLSSAFSFLLLYVYKFHVANKALLEINPNFYEEREYSKWFDYYVKKQNNKRR